MRKTLLTFWFALSALTLFSLVGHADIGVSTLGIDIEVGPGNTHQGSFRVINNSAEPAEVRVQIRDFRRTLDGQIQVHPSGTAQRSLAPYVTYHPSRFTLEGGVGRTRRVSFTIALPEGEPGPHWAMLMVQEMGTEGAPSPESAEDDGARVEMRLRYGVQIRQVDPAHRANDGRITNMAKVSPKGDRPLAFIVDYENSGTLFQRPHGELRVIDAQGDVVLRVDVSAFWVFPGATRRLKIDVDERSLPPGDYAALAVLNFGGDYMVGGQMRFRIPGNE